ncbi:ABC transporter ATP-binding protein [Candidatus Sumerlaeota bacterium]|nr:ABC transporter ATP-binding protein [Candidatus Sumerlaeota bacterium]
MAIFTLVRLFLNCFPFFKDLEENPVFLRECGLRWCGQGSGFYGFLIAGLNGLALYIGISAWHFCCLLGSTLLIFSVQFYGHGGRGSLFLSRYLREEWESGRLESLYLSGLTPHEIIWGIAGAKFYRGTAAVLWLVFAVLLISYVPQIILFLSDEIIPLGINYFVWIALLLCVAVILLCICYFYFFVMMATIALSINIDMHLKLNIARTDEKIGIIISHFAQWFLTPFLIIIPPAMLALVLMGAAGIGWGLFFETIDAMSDLHQIFAMGSGAVMIALAALAVLALFGFLLYQAMKYFVTRFKRDCGPVFDIMLREMRDRAPSVVRSKIFGEK